MSESQPPIDNRTPSEKLDDIIKEFPIHSFWFSEKKDDKYDYKYKYYWVYGYESTKNGWVSLNSKCIRYDNNTWEIIIMNDINFDEVKQINNETFNIIETKLIAGFDIVKKYYIQLCNKYKDRNIVTTKDLIHEQKYIQFLSSVIRIGEYKKDFKIESGYIGGYIQKFNSINRQLSSSNSNEDYFTLITDLKNWSLREDDEEMIIITEEEYNEINELFDNAKLWYQGLMSSNTEEEFTNFLRGKKLEKMLT